MGSHADGRRSEGCSLSNHQGEMDMRQKIKRILPLLLAGMLTLAGCGRSSESLSAVDGLDALGSVQVVSREEGSGTRSAFAQLVGFDTSSNSGSSDETTADALIAENADAVIEAVAADAAAIGYVSMGALKEDGASTGDEAEGSATGGYGAEDNATDGDGTEGSISDGDDADEAQNQVKVLTVDGVDGTLENAASSEYSLSRPFILAWSGSLSELEQDFLTYVMGKGQAIVEQSYIAVTESTTFLSGQYEGAITISGSTSVAPLLEELAEEYMSINTHAVVEITATDSTAGINAAMQGTCDLAMASRDLEDYEKELLSYKTIARDGIAVIVNAENPLTEMTTGEIKSLFTGEYTEWADINSAR